VDVVAPPAVLDTIYTVTEGKGIESRK
jgi:hypothetical protein